jgi:hypothetical protein
MSDEKDKQQNGCLECKKKKDARWREDFPVEWESDNYITRREMVKFLALGSLTISKGQEAGITDLIFRSCLNTGMVWSADSGPVLPPFVQPCLLACLRSKRRRGDGAKFVRKKHWAVKIGSWSISSKKAALAAFSIPT